MRKWPYWLHALAWVEVGVFAFMGALLLALGHNAGFFSLFGAGLVGTAAIVSEVDIADE